MNAYRNHVTAGDSDKIDMAPFVMLFRRFYARYWKSISVVLVLYTVAGIVMGLEPLVFAPLIDLFSGQNVMPATRLSELNLNNLSSTLVKVLGLDASRRIDIVLSSIVCYVSLAVVWSLLTLVAFVISLRTRTAVSRDMTVVLHRHLLDQPVQYFHNRSSGEFVSRLTHDILETASALDTTVRGTIQAVAELLLYGLMLFRTDPLLSLVVLALGSVHLGITRLLSRRARVSTRDAYDRRGRLSHLLLESLQGIRIIKTFAGERYDSRRMSEATEDYRQKVIRHRTSIFIDQPIRHIADALLMCIALGLSFYAMSRGRLQTGGFILFVGLSMRAIAPVAQCAKNLLNLHSMLGGAARLSEMFAAKTTIADGSLEPGPLRDRLEFHDVCFEYEPGRPVLRHINLSIRHGETVALVGPSGGGKTTLADLTLRLFDVTSGSITYDGVDIREFRQRAYRRHFGVVPQESLLFHASLRENIVYSREPDEAAIRHAVEAANVSEFVDSLPEGLHTVTGERGVKLSGGQRQRIAIARAIYGRPAILILDEATSSLDSESERAVQAAIGQIVKGMTAIIIAHRLSTVRDADKVVVINAGQIEAMGRHEELLKISETYRHLCELQFQGGAARTSTGRPGVGKGAVE